jgi:hypothetical protein
MLNDSIINVKLKTKREKIKIAAKKLFMANARWGSLNFMQDSICAGEQYICTTLYAKAHHSCLKASLRYA